MCTSRYGAHDQNEDEWLLCLLPIPCKRVLSMIKQPQHFDPSSKFLIWYLNLEVVGFAFAYSLLALIAIHKAYRI